MSDNAVKPGSSSGSAGLLLQVCRSNGQADEFYLAPGLTIGRTVANSVRLADDEKVDREHACVEFNIDGTAMLRCIGPGNELSVGDTSVREIGLTAGVKFRIGRTDFECIPGERQSEEGRSSFGSVCPSCGSTAVPTASPTPVSCPSCGQSVFALDLGAAYPRPFVVPVKYGEFQADYFVARGGMGLVLSGFAATNKQRVAIKILLPIAGINRQAKERFNQEIAMMKRISHPNVVRLIDFGHTGHFNFLVTEWVEGGSLRDVITDFKRRHKLPLFQNVFSCFDQVCKGLAAIHAVGIIHRDIKPSNILVARDGRVLLSDLGVAKRTDRNRTVITMPDQLPGTYEYMAPEQLDSPETIDQRTDLYALGVTFYELLTGERPVGTWPPASKVNSSVPPAFDQILSRLLAQRKENRYADIHELIAAIMVVKQSSTSKPLALPIHPIAPPPSPSHASSCPLKKSFNET